MKNTLFTVIILAIISCFAGCKDEDNLKSSVGELQEISITPQAVFLTVDGTRQLTTTPVLSSITNVTFEWFSADTTIAVVSDDGLVTGKKIGTTTVSLMKGDHVEQEVRVIVSSMKLAGIFNDNMVIQQESQISIWGWTQANNGVEVISSWDNQSYLIQSDSKGYWKAIIQTPKASVNPYSLIVNGLKLNNILIGEVWLCSGQSNMEMTMTGWTNQPIAGGPEDINKSSNPNIRHFAVKQAYSISQRIDCESSKMWEEAKPTTVKNWSATAYYFARLLNAELNIPIGLINSSVSATGIETWMPAASLSDIPEKTIPASFQDIILSSGVPKSATVIYNAMIHPISQFKIRGVIWYQGEDNVYEPNLYVKMFDHLVRGWRNIWGIGDFPFYYCQVAPYDYGSVNSAYLREAQAKGMLVPNTGMAVLMDANSPSGIHPSKKKDAGERLAFWALAKTYGKDIPYRSPEYKSLTINGNTAVVSFDMFGLKGGLSSFGKEIKHFEIAGSNKQYYPATATLSGDQITLFSPNVATPVAVRYCWDNLSVTELFSMEGNLPVSSFRTDQ